MDHFRGIYRRIHPDFVKENWRMSTCDRLGLQTLGSQPIMNAQKSPRSLVVVRSWMSDHNPNFHNTRGIFIVGMPACLQHLGSAN